MPNRVRDTKSSKKIIYFMLVVETYGQLSHTILPPFCCNSFQIKFTALHLGDVLVVFVIFAVLDVSFAVNSCLNRSFFTFISNKIYRNGNFYTNNK